MEKKNKKSLLSTWKEILIYCREYKWPFIASVAASIIGTVLMLIGPEKLSEITDLIADGFMKGIDMAKVTRIGIALAIIYGLSFALSALKGWIMSTVTQKISKKMRRDISEKINRLPMSYFGSTTSGDILSRVTNDVDTLSQSLNQSISGLITSFILFFGSLIIMFATNAIMAISVVLATMLGFVGIVLIMKNSQKYFKAQQKHLGALNGKIEEIYSGQLIVKAYNAEDDEKEDFKKLNEKLRISAFKANALSSLMMPIMNFIGNFSYVIVCVVGALLVLNGSINYGAIVAFMVYVRYFTQPLSQIAQSVQMLQSAAAAGNRVFEFLAEEEMPKEEEDKKLVATKGNVEFDHVRFGYDKDKMVIKDFSAVAKAGQKVSIVGPTGAGKTTLVNLLMKFYDIQGGDIRIDNISIKDMTRKEVHEQFSMVLQDTWLFEGSIRENLIYSGVDISEEKMIKACKAVGIDHFIRTLPKGYDTVLDSKMNLSQGQRQQLTIARAMIDDKPMIILDEATSSVDTHTELQIQKAMDELTKGRTSFVIAHRLSTIKNSDLILVLKDGDVLETGRHEELLEKNGFYAELYNSQFE